MCASPGCQEKRMELSYHVEKWWKPHFVHSENSFSVFIVFVFFLHLFINFNLEVSSSEIKSKIGAFYCIC